MPEAKKQPKASASRGCCCCSPFRMWASFRKAVEQCNHTRINNPTRFWFYVCLLVFVLAMAVWGFADNCRGAAFDLLGWSLPTAKAGAYVARFTWGFVLVPVSRGIVTYLRDTPLRFVFPFDDAIQVHKVLVYISAAAALLHTGSHVVNVKRIVTHSRQQLYFTKFGTLEPQPDAWDVIAWPVVISGIVTLVLMLVIIAFAIQWTRTRAAAGKKGCLGCDRFNTFWYSHHLYIAFYAAYLTHIQDKYMKINVNHSWRYILFFVVVFSIDRLWRLLHSQTNLTELVEITLVEGQITGLRFKKPQGYTYRAGQYAFLQCPAISVFEWHPFTISSAPEEDTLSMHIAAAGDWTSALHVRMREYVHHHVAAAGKARANDASGNADEQLASEDGMPESVKQLIRSNAVRVTTVAAFEDDAADDDLMNHTDKPVTIGMASLRRRFSQGGMSQRHALADDIEALPATRSKNWLKVVQAVQTQVRLRQAANAFQDLINVRLTAAADNVVMLAPSIAGPRATSQHAAQHAAQHTGDASGNGQSEGTPSSADVATHNVTSSDQPAADATTLDNGDVAIAALPNAPRLRIGPAYGAPAQNHGMFRVLLMVAGGIGVTPFASILRSIVQQMKWFRCDKCNSIKLPPWWKLEQVYFYWVVKDPQAGMLFADLLQEVVSLEHDGRLRVVIHITDKALIDKHKAQQRGESRDMELETAESNVIGTSEVVHALVSDSKHVTLAYGRPNWPSIFAELSAKHACTIGTFFCGPKAFATVLNQQCTAANAASKTKKPAPKYTPFKFYKEHF